MRWRLSFGRFSIFRQLRYIKNLVNETKKILQKTVIKQSPAACENYVHIINTRRTVQTSWLLSILCSYGTT